MSVARTCVFAIGAVALLVGLVWIGQGLGYFRYPPSSFMIDQSRWAWRGLGVAAAGVLLIVVGVTKRGR